MTPSAPDRAADPPFGHRALGLGPVPAAAPGGDRLADRRAWWRSGHRPRGPARRWRSPARGRRAWRSPPPSRSPHPAPRPGGRPCRPRAAAPSRPGRAACPGPGRPAGHRPVRGPRRSGPSGRGRTDRPGPGSGARRSASAISDGAPLEQLDHAGQSLVGRGQAGRPVRRAGERAHQLVLGGLARSPARRRVAVPCTAASRWAASARAEAAAAARSRSPGDGGESSRTAAVERDRGQPPARQPVRDHARRARRRRPAARKGSSAAVTPEAALGPATPAKKMPNATGIVTRTASQVIPLTAVPMISPMLPTTASPRCAIDLVPPGAAERGEDQARESAERGEQGHLQVAEALVGHGEQRGDHEHRA